MFHSNYGSSNLGGQMRNKWPQTQRDDWGRHRSSSTSLDLCFRAAACLPTQDTVLAILVHPQGLPLLLIEWKQYWKHEEAPEPTCRSICVCVCVCVCTHARACACIIALLRYNWCTKNWILLMYKIWFIWMYLYIHKIIHHYQGDRHIHHLQIFPCCRLQYYLLFKG